MKRSLREAALTFVALLGTAGATSAGQSLSLDGNYNHTTIDFKDSTGTHSESGGGSIGGALNGQPLSYLYCLEFNININVPGTYGDSVVSTTGQIHGVPLANRLEIAWLMLNVAPTIGNSLDKQAGLQALLWDLTTTNFQLLSGGDVATYYTQYKNQLSGAVLSPLDGRVLFLSPSTDGDVSNHNQGLVGVWAVPEPTTIATTVAGVLTLATFGLARRRRRDGAVPSVG